MAPIRRATSARSRRCATSMPGTTRSTSPRAMRCGSRRRTASGSGDPRRHQGKKEGRPLAALLVPAWPGAAPGRTGRLRLVALAGGVVLDLDGLAACASPDVAAGEDQAAVAAE